MADESSDSAGLTNDLLETKRKLEALGRSYKNLKGLSQKAVSEFEALQEKCQGYYEKFKEQETKYLKVKADLEKLKEVSVLALNEYENLHDKYEVEQNCRSKAEEFATSVVKQNKELKRQSQLLFAQADSLGLNPEEFSSIGGTTADDNNSLTENAVLHVEIKELKEMIESLNKELKTSQNQLTISQNEIKKEKASHEATKKRMLMNEKQLKQLNRVSVLALDEFNVLQQKYELEAQCRLEAEKYAAEVLREKNILDQQRKYISESTGQDEQLKNALDEISQLNRKISEDRTEYEQKIKDLLEDMKASEDGEFIKVMEEKLHLAEEHIESLEQQLADSEKKVSASNQKVLDLEKSLEDAKKQAAAEPPLVVAPPAPPPPPPPPPPTQLIKKFMNIVGNKKRKDSLNRKKEAAAKDPLADAMAEMMKRIKSGNLQLKPVASMSAASAGSDCTDAMSELGSLLKTLKRGPSVEISSPTPGEETTPECEWAHIKLRKSTKISVTADEGDDNNELTKVVLRKPRSRSAGDVLDSKPKDETTWELKKVLQKQKAAAEKDMPSTDENVGENPSC